MSLVIDGISFPDTQPVDTRPDSEKRAARLAAILYLESDIPPERDPYKWHRTCGKAAAMRYRNEFQIWDKK